MVLTISLSYNVGRGYRQQPGPRGKFRQLGGFLPQKYLWLLRARHSWAVDLMFQQVPAGQPSISGSQLITRWFWTTPHINWIISPVVSEILLVVYPVYSRLLMKPSLVDPGWCCLLRFVIVHCLPQIIRYCYMFVVFCWCLFLPCMFMNHHQSW